MGKKKKTHTFGKKEKPVEDNGIRWQIVSTETGRPVYAGDGIKDIDDGEKRARALSDSLLISTKVVSVQI